MVVEFVIAVVPETETEYVNMSAVFATEAAEVVMVVAFAVVQTLSTLQVYAPARHGGGEFSLFHTRCKRYKDLFPKQISFKEKLTSVVFACKICDCWSC